MDDVHVYDFETHKGGVICDLIRQYPDTFLMHYPDVHELVYLWYNLEDPDQKQPELTEILQNPPFFAPK